MAEGWYCPGCKAHHGPHVDTCPKAEQFTKLEPAIGGNAVIGHYDYLRSLGLRK